MISVVECPHLFDRTQRRVRSEASGRPLGSYATEQYDDRYVRAIVNGRDGLGFWCDREDPRWNGFAPRDGDEVSFVHCPEGKAVTSYANLWVKGMRGLFFGPSYWLMRRVRHELKPDPILPQVEQRHYTFTGIKSSGESGIPIPIVFGRHPVGGNKLAISNRGKFTDEAGDPHTSILTFVLGLCEGEIEEIESVRVEGNDSQQYGDQLTFENRKGTLDQEPLDISSMLSTAIISVGLPLTNESPLKDQGIIRTVTTEIEIDAFRVNIFHPEGLYYIDPFGGGIGAQAIEWSVSFKLHSDPDVDDSWSAWEHEYVPGTVTAPFMSTSRHDVPERGIYDIRIRRRSERPILGDNAIDAIELDSVVQVSKTLFSHPGLAHIGVIVRPDEKLNTREPNVVCIVKGLKCEIWDGVDPKNPTFTRAYTNNPAWVALEILRNLRWGLGRFTRRRRVDGTWSNGAIDLPSFLELAEWCDELVNDGQGGLEKRFLYDGVCGGGESAWSAFLRVLSQARAFPVVLGERIKIKIDRPREPVQLFSMGNIEAGSFKVNRLAAGRRATQHRVRFLDQAADWQLDDAPADDEEAIAKGLPVIVETTDGFGATRRSENMRQAKYRLKKAKLSIVVEWVSSVNSIRCEPGDLVEVQHDVPAWGICGGLLAAGCATTGVRLDRVANLEPGKVYEVRIQFGTNDAIETRKVIAPAAQYAAGELIAVDPAFSAAPGEFDVYSLGIQNILTRPVMIREVLTEPDFRRRFVAVGYDARIYDDDIGTVEPIEYSTLPDPGAILACPPPPGVVSRMDGAGAGGGGRMVLDVSWEYPDSGSTLVGSARIYRRQILDEDPPEGFEAHWDLMGEVPYPTTTFTIQNNNLIDETYDIVVILVSPDGYGKRPGSCTATRITVKQLAILLPAPTAFGVVRAGLELIFSWEPVAGAAGIEIRRGKAWDASVLVATASGSASQVASTNWAPTDDTEGPTEERFHIRAISLSGHYGSPAHLTVDDLAPWHAEDGSLVRVTRDEAGLAWPGEKDNLEVTLDNRLRLIDTDLPGTYLTGAIDLEHLEASAYAGMQLWARAIGPTLDETEGTFDDPDNNQMSFHGPVRPHEWPYAVIPEIRIAELAGDLGGAPWRPFDTTQWLEAATAAGFRFAEIRLTLTAGDGWQPYVDEMYLTIEVPEPSPEIIPSAPTNFRAQKNGSLVFFTWDAPPEEVASYEIRRGEAWDASIFCERAQAPATQAFSANWAPTDDTDGPTKEFFHIRAIGPTGLYGSPAKVEKTLTPPHRADGSLVITTRDERGEGWDGTKVNCEVDGEGRLAMTDVELEATYETPGIDMGALDQIFWVGAQLWARADTTLALNDFPTPWNAAANNQMSMHGPIPPADWPYEVLAEIRFATTEGGLAAAEYSRFPGPREVHSDTVTGFRWIQIRLTLSTTDPDWFPRVDELYLTVEDV